MSLRPLLIAVATLLCTAVQAATYHFAGVIDAGPLSGVSFSGDYSVDEGLVTGSGFEDIALSDFALNFNGQVYGWNASARADYDGGVFIGLEYSVTTSTHALTMTTATSLGDAFLHLQPLADGLPVPAESSGSYGVSEVAVPEPGRWALMLAGMGAMALLARRRAA